MLGDISKRAKVFVQDCGGRVTTKAVNEYIKDRRWTYVEYHREAERDKRLCSLSPLIQEMVKRSDAFAYQVEDVTLIAVGSWVKPDRKLSLIVHEIGHILLGHDLYNLTDRMEKDADRFAALVLGVYRQRAKKISIVVLVAAALLAAGVTLGGSLSQQPPASLTDASASGPVLPDMIAAEVLITASGDKYHLPDCQYVKDRANVTTVSLAEALRLGKEPCKVCRPPEVAE